MISLIALPKDSHFVHFVSFWGGGRENGGNGISLDSCHAEIILGAAGQLLEHLSRILIQGLTEILVQLLPQTFRDYL